MSNNSDMIKLLTLMEGQQFAGEPQQKPGDQVRGTDKAASRGKQHPFHNRLVGEELSLEDKLSKKYQDMKDLHRNRYGDYSKGATNPDGTASAQRQADRYTDRLEYERTQKAEKGVEEDAPAIAKMAGGLGLGLVAAAGAPAIVGILGPLLGIPFAAYGAYSAAKMGMSGVEKLWDMATEKLGGSDKVEQYATAQIAKLPPEKAQAATAAIKQVTESRKGIAEGSHEDQVSRLAAYNEKMAGENPPIDLGLREVGNWAKVGHYGNPIKTAWFNIAKYGIRNNKFNDSVDRAMSAIGDFPDKYDLSIPEIDALYSAYETVYDQWEQSKSQQGVAEGVAESMSMEDAVKVLRQYGAGHFKTTTNELHFYKNGKPMSVDLIFNRDATRSVNLSQLNAVTRRLKGQGVTEELDDHNPVVSAISRRVMHQRLDLLQKYGVTKVMSAIDEVADFVGDVEEIGTSDVSGWVKHVEQMLGNMGELDEADVPPVAGAVPGAIPPAGTAPTTTATGAAPAQNPADIQKQKNDQRKAIQDQITATTKQLADLRTQLSSIQ